MLIVHRDAQDRLDGVCQYFLVDEQGRFDPQGKYVMVNQLELNPGVQSRRMIRHVIAEIARLCPTATAAYWERRNKATPLFRGYFRHQLHREEVKV